jgi:hypothetical protein
MYILPEVNIAAVVTILVEHADGNESYIGPNN